MMEPPLDLIRMAEPLQEDEEEDVEALSAIFLTVVRANPWPNEQAAISSILAFSFP